MSEPVDEASSGRPDEPPRTVRALWCRAAESPQLGACVELSLVRGEGLERSLSSALRGASDDGAAAALGAELFGHELLVLELPLGFSLEALRRLRAHWVEPVLLVVDGGELERLLPLEARDDVVLRGDPLALVRHRVRHLAHGSPQARDPLTGLVGKRAFAAGLAARCAAPRMATTAPTAPMVPAAPMATTAPISVLLVDLDRFKQVNDTHGHAAGDRVLAEVAARIASAAAPHQVARFGGEELALYLEARKDEALALAERLRRAVAAAPIALVDGAEVAITVSVGVATATGEPSAEALLRGADDALLAAKARGRDRVVHLEQVEREAIERDVPVQAAKLEDLTRVVTERVAAVLAHHGRRWFEEIRGQAEQDALTGLYARRYFDQRLRAELEAYRGGGRALAVALLDVDHFGAVNKTHGWPAGDLVLAEIAARVASGVRAADWVARYGGEELAIVLHDLPAAGLAPVLERVRQAVSERPIVLRDGTSLRVTVSIGAAFAGDADDSVTALLERVSEPLLAAKRAGRDRVCLARSPG